MKIPPEQEAIRARCFHPTGHFVEFPIADVEGSIPARFEQIASMYPERIAVSTGNDQITYGELNVAANRIANSLAAAYGTNQEPVVLFYERGIPFVVAYLAVLKAGKIAIHLGPNAGRARIIHVLEDSRSSIVLTNRDAGLLALEVGNDRRRIINVHELEPEVSNGSRKLAIGADAFAYIRYTSGSTKNAKGAVRTHGHILQAAMDLTNSMHICAEDRVAVFGRDYGGKNLFITLLNGAAQYPISLADDSTFQLADWLTQKSITILISLPTVFRSLLTKTAAETICPTLRLICLGSEPLYKSDINAFRKYFSSDCKLLYTYGSSETGIICENFIDKSTEIHGDRVPVGYPRSSMEVNIIDELANRATVNQPGEIVVKSRHLSSGYWHRRELKTEKFSANAGDDAKVSYFTGDVGRILPNGSLEHLGRKDSMIKIRGLKADLSEIEAVLANHSSLQEVVVVAKDKPTIERMIVAYYVQKSGLETNVPELRTYLAEKLPSHMIPTNFVRLEAFPLTATGKVNRRDLPNPGKSRPLLATEYMTPRNDLERTLSQIWSEVLDLDEVGVRDNFLDIGGHSLAATRIVSRVVAQFRIEISLQSLFQCPTVAEMAAEIEKHLETISNEKQLAAVIDELESLSDEDAQRLVSQYTLDDLKK